MLNGRKSLVTVIAAVAIVASVGAIPGGSAQAKPSIEDVLGTIRFVRDCLVKQAAAKLGTSR